MSEALAELLADMSAVLDERLASMRAADFVRDVSRENISAEEVTDILRRFDVARSAAGDDGDARITGARLQ